MLRGDRESRFPPGPPCETMALMHPGSFTFVRSFLVVWFAVAFSSVASGGTPKIDHDLVYREVDGRALRADVYYLSGQPAKPRPAVLFFHGGAWQWGSKRPCRLEGLCEHGYVVVSIEYRFSSEARFPAMLEDCRAAVRWLRENAARWHVDPARIGVVGVAAGGLLASLTGTMDDPPPCDTPPAPSSRVQAVILFSAPSDLEQFDQAVREHPDRFQLDSKGRLPIYAVERLLGGAVAEKSGLAREASSTAHVTPDDPPFFLAHAVKDPLVPVEQSLLLHAALTEAGVRADLRTWEGSGHGTISGQIAHAAKRFLDEILQP